MWGLALFLTRGIVSDLPDDVRGAGAPYQALEMSAVVGEGSTWQLAYGVLDMLGSHLIDEPPFMGMELPNAVQLDTGDVLLGLRVGVAAGAVTTMSPRLRFACEAIVLEFVDAADIRGFEMHVRAEGVG